MIPFGPLQIIRDLRNRIWHEENDERGGITADYGQIPVILRPSHAFGRYVRDGD